MEYLKQLSTNDGRVYYDMLQRIEAEIFAMHNEVNGASYEDYLKWLEKMDDWAHERNLPDGYVKQVTYWLMSNETPVGYVRLRFKLTEKSREYGGSFGYAIDPLYRKKGFGSILVRQIIELAKKEKIEEFFSMVDKNNIASNRIMSKNGGFIFKENEVYNYYKFW